MEPINLPLQRVAELEATLSAAMDSAYANHEMKLWIALNKSRAFVRAYLLANARVEVEVA